MFVAQVDVEKLDYHHYLPIFFDGFAAQLFQSKATIFVSGCVRKRSRTGSLRWRASTISWRRPVPTYTALNQQPSTRLQQISVSRIRLTDHAMQ